MKNFKLEAIYIKVDASIVRTKSAIFNDNQSFGRAYIVVF